MAASIRRERGQKCHGPKRLRRVLGERSARASVRRRARGGTPLALAHGTYSTAFHYLKAKLSMRGNDAGAGLIGRRPSRGLWRAQPSTEFSLAEKLRVFSAQGSCHGKDL